MRRVKLTTARVSGDGRADMAGDIIEVPADEAASLIRAGQAEPVDNPKQPRRG